MNNETIQLRNLSIGYQTKHSVKAVAAGINGAIRSGELTCLLGANGVGKSTLLRTLAAFQPAISGEIFVVERGKRKEITLRVIISRRSILIPLSTFLFPL